MPSQLTLERVNERVNERVSERVNERVSERVNERKNFVSADRSNAAQKNSSPRRAFAASLGVLRAARDAQSIRRLSMHKRLELRPAQYRRPLAASTGRDRQCQQTAHVAQSDLAREEIHTKSKFVKRKNFLLN